MVSFLNKLIELKNFSGNVFMIRVNKKILTKIFLITFITGFALIFFTAHTKADVGPILIKKNQILPLSSFTDKLTSEHISYLGLTGRSKFSFKDFKCDILVIELFSTYCMSCPKNYPVLNSVYNYVENDKKLKDKVKVIGIAIGNTYEEVNELIKKYNLLFPVLTDYRFSFHREIGSPRVPFTIIARNTTKNRFKVIYTHQGIIDNEGIILKNIPKSL